MKWKDLEASRKMGLDENDLEPLLSDAVWEDKRRRQLIKSCEGFWCDHVQRHVTGHNCLEQAEEPCQDCNYARTAQNILGNDFLNTLRQVADETVQEEPQAEEKQQPASKDEGKARRQSQPAEKARKTTREQDVQPERSGQSQSDYKFQTIEPSSVNQSCRPQEPCVSLTPKSLFINTDAIRQFELANKYQVTLLYDQDSHVMLLDFTDDHPTHMQLSVTHRNSGDAVVSVFGFRKSFGVRTAGKFKVEPYGEDKLLLRLNERIKD